MLRGLFIPKYERFVERQLALFFLPRLLSEFPKGEGGVASPIHTNEGTHHLQACECLAFLCRVGPGCIEAWFPKGLAFRAHFGGIQWSILERPSLLMPREKVSDFGEA